MALRLLLLYVALLPVVRPFDVLVAGHVVPPADFVAPAVVLAWLATGPRLPRPDVAVPLAAYAAALGAAAAASADPRHSALKVAGQLSLLAMAVVASDVVRTREDLQRVARAWAVGLGATLVVSAVGLAAWASGWRSPDANVAIALPGSLPPGPYPRLAALFHYPNLLASYLNASVGLPMPAPLLWAAVLAAVFTWSPGLAGFAVTIAVARRRGLAPAVALAAVFLAAALVSPAGLMRRALEPSPRVLAWQDALRTIAADPLTGRGPGLGACAISYRNASGEDEWISDAHDVWLNVAGEAGIPAAAALLWLTAALLRGPWRTPEHRALAAAVLGTWVVQGLTGALEDTRHAWVLFGLLAAARERYGFGEAAGDGAGAGR